MSEREKNKSHLHVSSKKSEPQEMRVEQWLPGVGRVSEMLIKGYKLSVIR